MGSNLYVCVYFVGLLQQAIVFSVPTIVDVWIVCLVMHLFCKQCTPTCRQPYVSTNANKHKNYRLNEEWEGKKGGARLEKLKCILWRLLRTHGKINRKEKHTHSTLCGVDNKIGISLLILLKPRRGSIVSIHIIIMAIRKMAFVVNEYVSEVFFPLHTHTQCISFTAVYCALSFSFQHVVSWLL